MSGIESTAVRAHLKRSPRGRAFGVRRHRRDYVSTRAPDEDFPEDVELRVVSGTPRDVRFRPTSLDPQGFVRFGSDDPGKVSRDRPHVEVYWNPGSQIRLDWWIEELFGPKMDVMYHAAMEEGDRARFRAPEPAAEIDPNWHEAVFPDTVGGAADASERLSHLLGKPMIVHPSSEG